MATIAEQTVQAGARLLERLERRSSDAYTKLQGTLQALQRRVTEFGGEWDSPEARQRLEAAQASYDEARAAIDAEFASWAEKQQVAIGDAVRAVTPIPQTEQGRLAYELQRSNLRAELAGLLPANPGAVVERFQRAREEFDAAGLFAFREVVGGLAEQHGIRFADNLQLTMQFPRELLQQLDDGPVEVREARRAGDGARAVVGSMAIHAGNVTHRHSRRAAELVEAATRGADLTTVEPEGAQSVEYYTARLNARLAEAGWNPSGGPAPGSRMADYLPGGATSE